MREHRTIRTHKGCVSSHSHVRFEILGSPTVSIFNPEAKNMGTFALNGEGSRSQIMRPPSGNCTNQKLFRAITRLLGHDAAMLDKLPASAFTPTNCAGP